MEYRIYECGSSDAYENLVRSIRAELEQAKKERDLLLNKTAEIRAQREVYKQERDALRAHLELVVDALLACAPSWLPIGVREKRQQALFGWLEK